MNKLYIADIRSNCTYNGISTGHFVPVAKMYQQLFAKDAEVVISGGPVYQQYFKEEELLVLPNNVSGDSFKHKLQTFQNARKLFKEAKGQTIVLQQSSDVTSHIALALFYHGGSNLYMIRYSNAGIASRFKRFIYSLCKHKVDGIICPNKEVGKAYGRPYCVVPDYIYTGNVSNVETHKEKKYDFCMVGRIAEEKGIVEVAQKLAGTKYKVIIAGKTQTEELADRLHRACDGAENIDLRIGYVSDEDYHDILASSKYTILNYQGEYSRRSSGVVFDTLFAGVPVIGQRCTALQFIEDYKVGYVYDSLAELSTETLDSLLTDTAVVEYRCNIETYRETHKKHKENLIKFILGK